MSKATQIIASIDKVEVDIYKNKHASMTYKCIGSNLCATATVTMIESKVQLNEHAECN